MLEETGLTCIARVYGGSALGLLQSQLRGADIWSCADIPHATTVMSDRAIALGGTRVLVLDRDADEAMALLADGPPMVSTGLSIWKSIVFIGVLFYCAAPPSPFAVFLMRPRNGTTQQSN